MNIHNALLIIIAFTHILIIHTSNTELTASEFLSRTGAAAGPATATSTGVQEIARLSIGYITHKTISNTSRKAHPYPTQCFVTCNQTLSAADAGTTLYATEKPMSNPSQLAVSNSVGNPCISPEWAAQDIKDARAALDTLNLHQKLIVSVFGKDIHDFAESALIAQKSGADIIELNLSCPNVQNILPYTNASMVAEILCFVRKQGIKKPITIKVGPFQETKDLEAILITAHTYGAYGVCGINTLPVQVINPKSGEPYFGKGREMSGLSGKPLYPITLEFIRNARAIIDSKKLNLKLFATGGAMNVQDLKSFLDNGADVAECATAFTYGNQMKKELKAIVRKMLTNNARL